jgi:3-phenylpropionate/trans-cinnamate dioxygenase ferredoxin component
MGNYVKVGSVSEFKDDGMKKVSVEGKDILLARVGGNYYAVGNKCAHMGGNLSAGKLEGSIVTCPRHGSQFDVKTGENKRWMKGSGIAAAIGKTLKSPQSLPVYKVKVEGDAISVEV